jgi:low temperature requirement protein LtrA
VTAQEAHDPGAATHPLLRRRDGHHARVTYEELFFDLVYVFAVTQLSHGLLHHLDAVGAVQTLVLWFAVWLGWQYTCWMTNWFDPQVPRVRGLLFATMLAALLMAAAIPGAFAGHGLVFAGAYVALQAGRTAWLLHALGPRHALSPNYRRMLVWLCIAAVFWLAGALQPPAPRLALWAIAAACEYVSPMFGFALPGLGRSHTREWTIEGGHLAERCQLFVIVALGETLLASGATLAEEAHWHPATLSALLATFLGTLAMWWLYFGTSSEDATRTITRSDDPGRIGARFHYVHAVLVAGIIATAVGNDLVMEAPHGPLGLAAEAALALGPALYLLGSLVYKRVVYGVVPRSHLAGVVALGLLFLAGPWLDRLWLAWLSTVVLLVVGTWEHRVHRHCR